MGVVFISLFSHEAFHRLIVMTDLQKIAHIVWQATYDEPEASQIAIAWALRNKGHIHYSGIKCQPELSLCHKILCDELEALKPCQQEVYFQLYTSQIWSVMANICRVWANVEEDPTAGSVAFHLHNAMPAWAVGLQPVALIGRRFFYNSPILNA